MGADGTQHKAAAHGGAHERVHQTRRRVPPADMDHLKPPRRVCALRSAVVLQVHGHAESH
jgi:hypothetical protein